MPRHQSLWAALAGSYALLSPPLQRFFARLSIFRGGWTAEAAAAVCAEPGARDYLTQLRSYTLVLLEESGEELRYRLLETLREFAAEQLASEEQPALARRHAEVPGRLRRACGTPTLGPEQTTWLNRLETEHPNLRAALAWSLEADGSVETALRLCATLQPFWNRRQHDHEGFRWVERALERDRSRGEPGAARLRAQESCSVPGSYPS